MMSTQLARFVHLSTARVMMGASKSNLAKLRKKTGFPFGNCKKALEVNNNDLERAEKWLEEQARALGWSKAMKMESRNTPQGLVGIALDKQYAAMVEVNCETDFVSKNEKFQKLVDIVAKTCLHHSKSSKPSPLSISKVILEGEEMGKLLATDQQSLSDHVVKNIAMVGERLVLRRAALVSAQSPLQLSAHTHPDSGAGNASQLGKYGAVIVYSVANGDKRSASVAKQLCQHVIGMNPTKIEASPDDPEPVKPVMQERAVTEREGEEDGEETVEGTGDDDETIMMRQAFLLDAERTVADVVAEANIKIEDFVRFECGEGLTPESEEVVAKAAQVGG